MNVKKYRFSDRSNQRIKISISIKYLGLTILLSLIATIAQARQITLQDDFEDQDLTQNPAWNGDLDDFRVLHENDNHLLQLNSEEAGHSILFTESETAYGSWEFYYRPEVGPTNNNRTFFILISDSDDFNFIGGESSSEMNGYALRAGDNSGHRAFKLGRVVNGNFQSSIITETETVIQDGVGYRVRVERSQNGDWQIFIAEGYGSEPVADSPVVNDHTFTTSDYFGLLVIYSGANVDKFFYDNIIVKGVSEGSEADDSDSDDQEGPDTDDEDTDGSDDSGTDDNESEEPDTDETGESDGSESENDTGSEESDTDSDSDNTDTDDTDVDDSDESEEDSEDSGAEDSGDSESDEPEEDPEDSGSDGTDEDESEGSEEEPELMTVPEVQVTHADQLKVIFYEPIRESTIQTDHFYLDQGIGYPMAATLIDEHSVNLDFAGPFQEGDYELSIEGVESESGSIIPPGTHIMFTVQNPFYLINANQTGSKTIDLEFSLDVDINSVSTEDIRISGIGHPAELKLTDPHLLRIQFDEPFEVGERVLTADRINGKDGWQIETETSISVTFHDWFNFDGLLISEFYYRVPVSWRTESYDRPQYIELYNRSNKRLNLRNMKISGKNISINKNLFIEPEEYLTITRGKPVFISRFGERNFVEADEFPRLNLTTSDRIHLETIEGETIEDLTFVASEWGGNSVSLERLSFDLSAEYRGNWAESVDALTGSPGLPNTVSVPSGMPVTLTLGTPEPQMIHLLFSRELLPESVEDLSNFTLNGEPDFESSGLDQSGLILVLKTAYPLTDGEHYTLGFTGVEDLFGNRLDEVKEIGFTFANPFYAESVRLIDTRKVSVDFSLPFQFSSIIPGRFSLADGTTPIQVDVINSTTVEATFIEPFGFGPHRLNIQGIVSFDPDINEQWILEPGTGLTFYRFEKMQQGDILLNEFMVRPPAGVPGYVELYNRSGRFLNLKEFELRRRPGVSNNGGAISSMDLPIKPNSYIVITNDSIQMRVHFGEGPWVQMNGYPGFTQTTADHIRLITPSGEVIQEVEYNPAEWGGNGVSLERRSLNAPVNHIYNWSPSIDERKGTPGMANSVEPGDSEPYMDEVQTLNDLSIFIKFGGYVYLEMVDKSNFQIDGGIQIEDLEILERNAIQLTLSNSLNSGQEYTLKIRNIIDIFGNRMEDVQEIITYYRVESAEPGDVVINEFMYNEPDDYSRYIELYNRSQKVIDLNGWQQANNTGTLRTMVNEATLFHPGTYLVIAPNDDLLQIFPEISLTNVGTRLSALKNGGDSIIIANEAGIVIDSLDYTPDWGGNGIALERLSDEVSSYLMENWAESKDPLLGTPGKPNSVEPDQNPPVLLSVHQCGNQEFILRFDKRPEQNIASDPSNYSFQPHLVIGEAQPDQKNIKLKIHSEMVSDQTYDLTVSNIRDIFGNVMEPVTVSVHYLELSESVARDIVINEILFRRAQAASPQFIEIYNRSEKNFDMSGWTLSNHSGSMILPEGLLVSAESYKVFSDTHLMASESEDFIILSNFRPFSSNGDQVVLRNSGGETVDSLYYQSEWRENPPGVSLERKDPDALSIDPHNWDLSRSETGSTPGKQNSRFEPDESPPVVMFVNFFHPDSIEVVFDKFVRITQNESDESEMENSEMNKSVNRGNVVSQTASETGSMSNPRFLINGIEVPVLKVDPRGSNRIVLDGSGVERGTQISLEIEGLGDYKGNELVQWSGWIAMQADPGDLLFNEIMYHPLADNRDGLPDQSEYLEIINTRTYPVSLEGIFLHDEPDENGNIVRLDPVSTRHTSISPNGYLLIYPEGSNSGFMDSRTVRFFELNGDEEELTTLRIDRNTLSLTNSGRAVYLADSTLQVIDRVHYSPDWHNPNLIDTRGIALERISTTLESDSPDNWSSSANTLGGTPGRANSIFQHPGAQNEKIGITVEPNPFSPDGDGFEDHLFIQYRLDEPDYLIRIRIFDRYGRLVRNLVNGEAAGFEGTRIWDGRMENGQNNRIGIYIILFDAFDSANGRNLQFRETAVIARRF